MFRLNRKLPMPSKRQLKKDYDELRTLTAVAKKYEVSDTLIFYWFKKLGLKTIEQELKGR